MNLNGKPQVMVVDDDLSMCNFLRTFLTERGYQAVTLGSADEAVKRGNDLLEKFQKANQ